MTTKLRLAAILLAFLAFAVLGYVLSLNRDLLGGFDLRSITPFVLLACLAAIIIAVVRKRRSGPA